jgi:hypothetical protein
MQAEQPPNGVRDGMFKSQGQRQREALSAGPAISKHRTLVVRKHIYPPSPDRNRGAVTSSLLEKEELQEQQPSEPVKDPEDELHAKLKSLEEQVALLQKKLESAKVAEAASPRSSEDREIAVETTPASERQKGQDTAAEDRRVGDTSSHTTSRAARRERKRGNASSTATDGGRGDSKAAVNKSTNTRKTEEKTLAQQIQAQSSSMRSSSYQQSAQPASTSQASSSLLEELFPEASSNVQPAVPEKRASYPKLDLPTSDTNPRIRLTLSDARSEREKAIEAFQKSGEETTVLQLSNCSTALTEADFRRLIPRGLHIESWTREGEFYKIIAGRDPLSLERLPFYYLLFRSPASALAYQKNASRLSKLRALHQPSSIHSAIPSPRGFLEDGEDIDLVTSTFVLHPTGHTLDLRTVMQPYNRALRALIEAGGYAPIVPEVDDKGKKIYRVLIHIEGYEPSHWDLWQIFQRHAHAHGIIWPFRNEHASAVRRLRDVINLRTTSKLQAAVTVNPRAADSRAAPHADAVEYEDAGIADMLRATQSESPTQVNQLVMNRVYNRWIVEFEDADAARRFAIMWHRVVLPDVKDGKGAWREVEERRMVNAEFLW